MGPACLHHITSRIVLSLGLLVASHLGSPAAFNDAPDPPGAPTLVAGHCGGFWASWPPSASESVAGYLVRARTASGAPTHAQPSAATSTFVDGLSDATNYFVSVAAVDPSGNQS